MTRAGTRIGVVVLATLTGVGTVGRAAETPPVHDIPRMDGITVDGKADDWGTRGFRVDLLLPLDTTLRPAADCDAGMRLGWNEQGLLLLVRMRDNQWVEHPDGDQMWRLDSIETFLAPKRGADNPLGRDAWGNAIKLYRRVIKENPGTKHAANARWCVATCTGCWARYGCCFQNQGKRDWRAAIGLYEQLYKQATDPGSKCNALRRIAEIQCNRTGKWRKGLATYRRMLREFPKAPPKAPYWTGRTCGTLNGTGLVDYDLTCFTHERLMREAKTADAAVRVRDAFVKLAPPIETLRWHTRWQLARTLRRLGDEKRARALDATIGLCDTWLVIGPFDNNRGIMDKTVHGPEKDFLAGTIDLNKSYTCSTSDDRLGRAMWVLRAHLTASRIWKVRDPNGLYALTYVTSDKAREAQLRVGTTGGAKVWLNRRQVFAVEEGTGFTVMDAYVRPVRLKPGKNELFIKFAVTTGFLPDLVRITDTQGNALAGITYSVPAVPATNEKACDFLRPRKE